MADREKVIKGLECCTTSCEMMSDCPYSQDCHGGDPEGVSKQLLADALALLREQEEVSTIVEPLNDTRYIFCGACKAMLAQNKPKGYKYCPWCGRKVKWDAPD